MIVNDHKYSNYKIMFQYKLDFNKSTGKVHEQCKINITKETDREVRLQREKKKSGE